MASGYGVDRVGEAAAVFAVVRVVAVDVADLLAEEIDVLADEPHRFEHVAESPDGQPVAYTFWWPAYAVTVVVRLSDRANLVYVDRVTIVSGVGGINRYA